MKPLTGANALEFISLTKGRSAKAVYRTWNPYQQLGQHVSYFCASRLVRKVTLFSHKFDMGHKIYTSKLKGESGNLSPHPC